MTPIAIDHMLITVNLTSPKCVSCGRRGVSEGRATSQARKRAVPVDPGGGKDLGLLYEGTVSTLYSRLTWWKLELYR